MASQRCTDRVLESSARQPSANYGWSVTFPAATSGSQPAHVIVDSGALTIGVIGAGIAVLSAIGFIASLISGSFVLAIFLGLLALVAGLFGWLGLRQHLRWEPAELHFDEWPLTLGSTNQVRLLRRSKRPLADTTLSITSETHLHRRSPIHGRHRHPHRHAHRSG